MRSFVEGQDRGVDRDWDDSQPDLQIEKLVRCAFDGEENIRITLEQGNKSVVCEV